MRVIVYHAGYGCDTGCCGHIVQLEDGREQFHFDHPYGVKQDDTDKLMEFAKGLIRESFGEEHIADLDWENCVVTDSC